MLDRVKAAAQAHLDLPGWTGAMLADAKAAIEHVNTVANALMAELAAVRRERAELGALIADLRRPGECTCGPSEHYALRGGLCARCGGKR